MDDTTKITIDSYNRHASFYADFQSSLKPVKKHLDLFIQSLTGNRVLDVGCGHGRESEYLHQNGLLVTGVDLSEGLLRVARDNAPQINFIVMDMRRLDFPKDSFDGLWVNTSFLHLPKKDAKKTLAGFSKVLKPGGILFMAFQGHPNEKATVVEKLGPQERLVATPEFGLDKPRFFAYYSVEEMKKLLKETGFETFNVSTKKEPETRILWVDILAKSCKK